MALTFAKFRQRSGLFVYMDDLIACSATSEAHLELMEQILKALQAAGLTIKPSKIHFGPKEVKYLGHILSHEGIRLGEDQIKSIVDLPKPKKYQRTSVNTRHDKFCTEINSSRTWHP